ncbi:MAG: inositol oxygenase family protein, partial [Verrucomicrobiota bacterium]
MNPLETEAVKKPLQHIGEWEDFVLQHYPEPTGPAAGQENTADRKPAVGYAPDKKEAEFRNYEADARPTVREFYRLNHTYQTHEFALAKRKEYLGLNRMKMGVWEAAEDLTQLVDDSDPD